MNDDLGDRPLDPGTGNQGQSAASEVVRTEQFVKRSDLQALQSSLESQLAKTRREAQDKVREANIALAAANAIIKQAETDNPDDIPRLTAVAKAAQLEAEVAALKAERQEIIDQQQQQEAAYQQQLQDIEAAQKWYTSRAQKYGVDPNSKEFQDALQQTLSDGDEWHVMEILMKGKFGQSQAASVPQTIPVLPPSGGGPAHALNDQQREELSGILIEKMKEPTKNAPEIAALKAKLGLL